MTFAYKYHGIYQPLMMRTHIQRSFDVVLIICLYEFACL